MINLATKILVAIEKAGDMSLEDISALIPQRWNDHRDFYVFASLVTQGLIDDPFLPQDGNQKEQEKKEQLLSWKYYAMSSADKTASYRNRSWSIHGGEETLKGQRFALSGAGRLHLEEARSKRFDRILTIASGIGIGILVALCTAYFESLF